MSVSERLVTIQRASEILGISIVSLHGSNDSKYQPFRRKAENGRVVMFYVSGFEYMESLMEQLTEKTKLFVEYLYHIEGMDYLSQARIAKLDYQCLYTLKFGYKFAIKFMRNFADFRPFHLLRFDEYYGWNIAPIRRRKVLG